MQRSTSTRRLARVALLPMVVVGLAFSQKLPQPTRVWSVGPLTKSQPAMGISIGNGVARLTGPQVDSQTGSIAAATRSVVFAGDRIVIASMTGLRNVAGAQVPESVYNLFSLDAKTGEVKDTREISAFAWLALFATNDGHVIISGRKVLRLTADLKDDGALEYDDTRFGRVENISPDGSTIGGSTTRGFELVDARTLKATMATTSGVDTSISSKGYVTDNQQWIGSYPHDRSFVTYIDAKDERLLYHGNCGGRPQFLRDDLVLVPGCKNPLIVDTQGHPAKTVRVSGAFSYAGVSQNGQRFALQIASFSGMHSTSKERFVIYSVDTGEPVTEITPDQLPEAQSWTAFSPDGKMFVVGSPLKLTLWRLP